MKLVVIISFICAVLLPGISNACTADVGENYEVGVELQVDEGFEEISSGLIGIGALGESVLRGSGHGSVCMDKTTIDIQFFDKGISGISFDDIDVFYALERKGKIVEIGAVDKESLKKVKVDDQEYYRLVSYSVYKNESSLFLSFRGLSGYVSETYKISAVGLGD